MRARTLATGAALGVAAIAISATAATAAPGSFTIAPNRGRPGQSVVAVTNICRSNVGVVTSPALNTFRVTRGRNQRLLSGRTTVRRVRVGNYPVTLTCVNGGRAFTQFRVTR